MRRIGILVMTLLLAGCTAGRPGPGGSSGAPRTSPTNSSATPPTASSTPTPALPTSGGATGSGATGTGATTGGTAAGKTRCHTADLRITIAAGEGGGAAGTVFEVLLFANKSTRTCTLYGYPGVSFVAGAEGAQVGDAFTRTEGTAATISLTPGAQARVSIGLPQTANFPADVCKPVAVRGLRVYPPDERAAVFVSQPQPACSVRGEGVGQVLPITR